MKQILRSCLLTISLVLLLSSFSQSQDRGFGVGVVIGEPTGISIKNWLSKTTAFDAAIAWSFSDEDAVHIHATYLVHSFDTFEGDAPLALYYGVGGRIKASEKYKDRVGVRGVIGIGYLLRTAPLDFFLEVAPILDLAPDTDLSLNAGIGARYFFGQ